jgi:filamentous hemagglutinin family protein
MRSHRRQGIDIRIVPCLVGGWLLSSAAVAAGPALPVPCATGACGATGPSQWVTSGAATGLAGQNSLTVHQTSASAILNWSSFNIGAGGSVVFNQPSASAIALNRIFQGSPSQIFGKLSANGQVYLLNLNGFLFGPTAAVNVGSLLVSSLPLSLTDANFADGILSPLQNGDQAVFNANLDPLATGGRTSVLDVNGKPVLDANGNPIPVQVMVQPGAKLAAADQGRILLTGQNVTNGGSLTAPDGQVILAAGTQVFLQADSDPGLRGLVVEVDGTKTTAADGTTSTNTSWNQLSGLLSAPRGNVWMVGLAVNQDGRISATTSVSANGSIHLEAAGNVGFGENGGTNTVFSTAGGALTVGPQAEMDIMPDASSGTAVAAQTQLPSTVTLLGEQVELQGGSIVAPGGTLTAIAAVNPSAGVTSVPDPNARLRIDSGTSIDLAGSAASLPATANLVEAQLRSSELADDPTQRDGALHGLTVYIDARNGSPPIANLSGEIAAVPETIAQRTEAGGNAVLESEGDAVFAKGASIDVSGGSATYAGGVFQTSYLVGTNGQLYPIATASPLLSYVGVVNPTFTQTFNTWGVQNVVPTPGLSSYQPSYVEGAPAGSVQFAAPTLVMQGNLVGNAVNGIYQRTPSSAVPGGTLTIGIPGGVPTNSSAIDYLSPAVQLTLAPTPILVADDASLPGPLTLDLPASYLTGSGFTSTNIYSNYGVTLPGNTPLVLPGGSTLNITAARVDILSSITDPGGSLQFQNVFTLGSAATTGARPGVYIGDDVTLNVDGLWTNDFLTANAGTPAASSTWQNGGSIDLAVNSTGALLSLGNDVALHASGSGWFEANGTTVDGTGGSITLNAASLGGGLDVGNAVVIDAFGVNGSKGGTLSLTAPRVAISAGTATGWAPKQSVDEASATPGGVFQIYSSLFADYGFQSISLTANALVAPAAATTNVFTVDSGTRVDATVLSRLISSSAALLPSGTDIGGIGTVTALPAYLQPAERIALNALPVAAGFNTAQGPGTAVGDIFLAQGASITTAPGGAIDMTGLDSIVVDGTLRAPGGSVSLEILPPIGIYSDYEVGLLPGQRLELGPAGAIDVSGTLVSQPATAGLTLGKLLAGGTVNLFANRGSVLTDPGSTISIAGVSAGLDILQPNGAYEHEIAASAGGSLAVHSGESISLLGNIEAGAGSGGTSGIAAAGALDVELTRAEPWWGVATPAAFATFNQSPLIIELEPTVPSTVPASSADSNQALLGAAQLAAAGFDALRLEAGEGILLSSGFSLNLGRQIVLDAPVIAANTQARVALSAPYLQVGYQTFTGEPTAANTYSAQSGTGSLHFSGGEIDLLGITVFQGAANVSFASTGDLQLQGEAASASATSLAGGVTVAGNLTLDAARIYPTTATSFAITALEDPSTGIPGTVTIGQTGANPGTPLSAAGAVSISAYSITSTGTLYAPFGTIALNATNGITLGDGSLTSVSGNGLTIPFGATQFAAEQWTYLYDNEAGSSNAPLVITGVPTRAVTLTAPSVSITKRATINLAGGGDLSAYEWVPGPGGSTDALAAGTIPGLYAILPTTRGQPAPQDAQDTDPSIAAGESVYLSGGSGLAAGTYPLLPARYALLPGAFLIQVEPTYQSTSGGSLGALADGTPVIAGFLTYGATGLHQTPGYSGFALYPGSYGNELAAYDISLASTFFSAAATAAGASRPTLPADSGSLSISVSNSLDAAGQVLTAAAAGGLAAPIAITSADLVVGSASGFAPADAVSISSAVLDSWNPGSLLLGGTLTSSTTGAAPGTGSTAQIPSTSIDVIANSVTLGAGATLNAAQIILVANQSIDVQSGATLQSNSAASGTAPTSLPSQRNVMLSGASANPGFLSVSDANWLIPERPAGAPAAGAGTVAIDAGASVASRGSLTVDALGGATLKGTLTGPGAEWSLGSSSIGIAAAGGTADSLSIDAGLLTTLAAASAVRLASTGSIDLSSPVTLGVNASGAPTLASLTLEASGINDLTGSGATAGTTASRFGAETLTLEGAGATAPGASAVAGPAGATLSLVAGELDVGPNSLAINGFGSTRAMLTGALIGHGTGALNIGGDFTVAAAGVTAATAADTTLNATGNLSVAAAGSGTLPQLLGGALNLSGNNVDIAGRVSAPAGSVTLSASQDLTVDRGAAISAAGALVSIGNQTAAVPAGSIIVSAGGNLTLNPGATLDVAGAGTATAGSIALQAAGVASIGATLEGNGNAGGGGAAGGSFSLDAGSLAAPGGGANPLSLLATLLGPTVSGSSGFDNSLDLRVRTGDVTLDASSTLSANSVTLTADTGSIVVDGQISTPSNALRGSVAVFGGAGVELAAGGVLRADGAGPSGRGGSIEIGAGQLLAGATGALDHYNNASISLDAGSTISTAGAAGEGSLLLRAPALTATNDIAITALASNTASVGQIIVEPVLPFNTGSSTFSSATAPSAADFQNVGVTVGNYMAAAAPAVAARLAQAGGTPVVVEAGVEIIAPGALTLPASGLDLSANGLNWHFNGAPVDLTVRAAGGIEVAGTISDGFYDQVVGDDGTGVLQPTLLAGPSASMRLVAGADLSSANPVAVVAAGPGLDLTIDPGVVVRTGTGNINLAAAGNITLLGAGSGAYTAGVPAIAPGGNAATPYPGVSPSLGTTAPNVDNNGNPINYGVFVVGTSLLMSYSTGGGNLTVHAGGDIDNDALTSPGSVTGWQLREGASTASTPDWGVNLAAYDWNFGTLGGGDLRLSAGGSAINVSAAAADSLLPQAAGATPAYVTGGGLSFTAGKDIGSAQVFLADGVGSVKAGGALTATESAAVSGSPNVGSAFYLQSSALDVTARLGAIIDGAYNPTALNQPKPAGFSSSPRQLSGSFYSYGNQSALSVQTVAGDIELGTSSAAVATLLGIATVQASSTSGTLGTYPASLLLGALTGNIIIGAPVGTATLYPSPVGQLDLLAGQDIVGNGTIGGGRIIMSDAAPGSVGTVTTPGLTALSASFGGDLHTSDADPALVTAGGSILNLSLVIPKPTSVVAGADIVDLSYLGQNLNSQDLTLVSAGRDITLDSGDAISVGGPGSVDLLAGRNISLGLSQGVITTGNLLNANLPSAQGADITMVTGLGDNPNFSGFLAQVVAPSTAYQAQLVNYVEAQQGSAGLSFSAADAAFKNFTTNQQLPLIDSVFFNELSESGIADNTVPGAGFTQGYRAIDALFPGSRTGTAGAAAGAFAGDLTLQFSRIYTLSGGDITLAVPGGGIDVGLANPPASVSSRPASTLGIVAEGAGNIDIYAKNDVNVNSSRIFTLGGGNILIWSDEGSIDAGLGAKTSISAPPPSILINSDGTVTVDFSGAATGSGIRTIQTEPTTPAGNVDLIAPVGTVNAGDAGIGAAGNINIAARSVLGVTNINFGGTATGVPATVSNVSASLSGASNAAGSATNTATSSVAGETADKESAAPLAQTALSWLDVFVTGLGEENCKPADIECLKRQKTPTR